MDEVSTIRNKQWYAVELEDPVNSSKMSSDCAAFCFLNTFFVSIN